MLWLQYAFTTSSPPSLLPMGTVARASKPYTPLLLEAAVVHDMDETSTSSFSFFAFSLTFLCQ